jgi:hypothetical protein
MVNSWIDKNQHKTLVKQTETHVIVRLFCRLFLLLLFLGGSRGTTAAAVTGAAATANLLGSCIKQKHYHILQ